TLQLFFRVCTVAVRATDTLLIIVRRLVFRAERQAAGAAQLVLAGLESMPDGNTFVEYKTLAVPAAFFRRNGFKILQDTALQMVDLVKALRTQVGGGLFTAYAAGTE